MTAAKRSGARFETDVLRFLRDAGLEAERLAKTGRDDEGDIVFRDETGQRFVAELKVRRDKTTGLSLGTFLGEAEREAVNYASHRLLEELPVPLAVIKRVNHPIGESYVVMKLKDLIT